MGVDNLSPLCYNKTIERRWKKMSVKKILGMLFTILMIMAIMWFVLSYLDVVLNNLDEHPQYQGWNIFKIMVERHL